MLVSYRNMVIIELIMIELNVIGGNFEVLCYSNKTYKTLLKYLTQGFQIILILLGLPRTSLS